jgi:hypothetical protein
MEGGGDGLRRRAANADEIVGDDPPSPTQRFMPTLAAAVETVPLLGDADATLASAASFLAVAELTLLSFAFAFGAFG